MVERDRLGTQRTCQKAGMLENNAVKRRAFCMRKRVKYVTAHAQKFSDITVVHVFHLSELFTYPELFFGQLVQCGSDNRGCTV